MTVQAKDISTYELLSAVEYYWAKNPSEPRGAFNALSVHYPSKVVLAKMQRLSDQGLLECGSPPSYWLTTEGKTRLAEFRSAP